MVDEQVLGVSTTCNTFNIASETSAGARVEYYGYAHNPDSIYFQFCNDAIPRKYGSSIKWNAVSGTVAVAVSKAKADRDRCENYTMSLQLTNIRLIRENSTQDTLITSLVIKNGFVKGCIP